MLVVLVARFIVVFDTANINIFVWLALFWLRVFIDVKWLVEGGGRCIFHLMEIFHLVDIWSLFSLHFYSRLEFLTTYILTEYIKSLTNFIYQNVSPI